MKKGRFIYYLLMFFFLASCAGEQSSFLGLGPQAVNIIKLWWILFSIACLVMITVSFYLIKAAFRNTNSTVIDDQTLGRGLVWGLAGTISLLLVIIFGTLHFGQALGDVELEHSEIEVTGKMWWWQVRYFDDEGKFLFETANEIHIPTNRAIKVRLLSDTVIHSFWVPALAGKVDMIPGHSNSLTLKALKEGVFRGQCAEFCGVQHALMSFHVISQNEKEYQSWLEDQAKEYRRVDSELFKKGKIAFKNYDCVRCHSIKGFVKARDETLEGPDLTHFSTRKYLASATYPNTKGHLAGWILDPQSAKPGNYMPATTISGEDFKALLAFIEGLK